MFGPVAVRYPAVGASFSSSSPSASLSSSSLGRELIPKPATGGANYVGEKGGQRTHETEEGTREIRKTFTLLVVDTLIRKLERRDSRERGSTRCGRSVSSKNAAFDDLYSVLI